MAWIGSATRSFRMCYFWGGTGIKTWKALDRNRLVTLGATGVASGSYNDAGILKNLLKQNVRAISGYPGRTEVHLAVERGEVDGECGTLEGMPENWFTEHKINMVLRMSETKTPEFPDDVPWVGEFVTARPTTWPALRLLIAANELGRPFVASRQVPAEQIETLRTAFDATMRDPNYLAFATKRGLGTSAVTGKEAQDRSRRSSPRRKRWWSGPGSHQVNAAQQRAAKQDLRTWIAQMEAAGELQKISGADRERRSAASSTSPCARSATGACCSTTSRAIRAASRARQPLHLGDAHRADARPARRHQGGRSRRFWRDYMREPTIPPRRCRRGLLPRTPQRGDDIDLMKIPTPRWHEQDGGHFIGTGCMVIMRDPDTGWINYGAYRVQVHEKRLASVMFSKGKHGDLIMRHYHERGEPCPIAVVVGMHPALFVVAGLEIPYGKNEFEAAGGLLGEPIHIINGPATGLPIPGQCRDRLRGLCPPDDLIDEGPLGEWTGYYAGGKKKEPAIRIETLLASQRSDPDRRHPGHPAE